MRIRREIDRDYNEVYAVVKEAFGTAEHSDGNEHELVGKLRKSKAFVRELSLVAEDDGEIIGHIMLTKASIGDEGNALCLAPLSVLPEHQEAGIGSQLVTHALKIATDLGYYYVAVVGSKDYYSKFGFIPAEQLGISVPSGIPSSNFMAIKLSDKAGTALGNVAFAEPFGI